MPPVPGADSAPSSTALEDFRGPPAPAFQGTRRSPETWLISPCRPLHHGALAPAPLSSSRPGPSRP